MTGLKRKRLLVVEDHAPLLEMIGKSLELEGYEVARARSVRDALIYLAETVPDLIVSDIMMPGTDGFELARRVRANPRTDLIPIVFLTAKDGREDLLKGLKHGVDSYLTKPFEPEELAATVANIFERVRRTHRRLVINEEKEQTQISAGDDAPIADEALTETENKVAAAVARGLSNKNIAAELGINYRTVEMHVSHILAKKNLANRVELARDFFERERQTKNSEAD